MNLKSLFAKKTIAPVKSQRSVDDASVGHGKLDIEALDACVGGRDDAHSVDCYLRSTPSQSH